jgi:hypothetical protein
MTNMMTFYSVLSISRWSVVTLHPLLKASPQKFYGRHTESVDKYGVSISTGAPGPCSRFWRSLSCSFTFSFMCIFFYFICASQFVLEINKAKLNCYGHCKEHPFNFTYTNQNGGNHIQWIRDTKHVKCLHKYQCYIMNHQGEKWIPNLQ